MCRFKKKRKPVIKLFMFLRALCHKEVYPMMIIIHSNVHFLIMRFSAFQCVDNQFFYDKKWFALMKIIVDDGSRTEIQS